MIPLDAVSQVDNGELVQIRLGHQTRVDRNVPVEEDHLPVNENIPAVGICKAPQRP